MAKVGTLRQWSCAPGEMTGIDQHGSELGCRNLGVGEHAHHARCAVAVLNKFWRRFARRYGMPGCSHLRPPRVRCERAENRVGDSSPLRSAEPFPSMQQGKHVSGVTVNRAKVPTEMSV